MLVRVAILDSGAIHSDVAVKTWNLNKSLEDILMIDAISAYSLGLDCSCLQHN